MQLKHLSREENPIFMNGNDSPVSRAIRDISGITNEKGDSKYYRKG